MWITYVGTNILPQPQKRGLHRACMINYWMYWTCMNYRPHTNVICNCCYTIVFLLTEITTWINFTKSQVTSFNLPWCFHPSISEKTVYLIQWIHCFLSPVINTSLVLEPVNCELACWNQLQDPCVWFSSPSLPRGTSCQFRRHIIRVCDISLSDSILCWHIQEWNGTNFKLLFHYGLQLIVA